MIIKVSGLIIIRRQVGKGMGARRLVHHSLHLKMALEKAARSGKEGGRRGGGSPLAGAGNSDGCFCRMTVTLQLQEPQAPRDIHWALPGLRHLAARPQGSQHPHLGDTSTGQLRDHRVFCMSPLDRPPRPLPSGAVCGAHSVPGQRRAGWAQAPASRPPVN